ncbi:MAG TPA: O-antigen ligase family protein, partial [Candidatus Intestinimonas merdavium]|nr:O-antigen ligase family protein [Candidatus Intestinimonas merdavium]
CAIPFLPDTIFNRILTIFNLEDSSTSSRFPLYAAALEMIRTRPIRGAGLGTDAVRLAIKDMNLYHGTAPFVHAHNLYLQIWLETGLIGVLSYGAAMICGLKSAAKACKIHCPREVRLITIGAAAAVAGVLVDCLADYLWNYPRVMVIFWFLFALLLSGVKLARRYAQRAETGGAGL